MPSKPVQRENKAFFTAHAALLLVVLVGFGRSFYARPMFLDTPLTRVLAIHGTVLTMWFVLTVVQAWSALAQRRSVHRQLAWLAVPLVVGVVVTGGWVNTALALDIQSPQDPENMFIWANYMSLASFVALVVFAVLKRRSPQTHRRLMVFASISIIGPAFARFAFWPALGKMGLVFAPVFAVAGMLAMVVLVICFDVWSLRRPQAASWVGLAAILLPLVAGTGVALSGVGFELLHRT